MKGDLANTPHFCQSSSGSASRRGGQSLWSNIFLTPFDHKMTLAGLCLTRWADDFVVLCGTSAEAQRALAAAERLLHVEEGTAHIVGCRQAPKVGAGWGSPSRPDLCRAATRSRTRSCYDCSRKDITCGSAIRTLPRQAARATGRSEALGTREPHRKVGRAS